METVMAMERVKQFLDACQPLRDALDENVSLALTDQAALEQHRDQLQMALSEWKIRNRYPNP